MLKSVFELTYQTPPKEPKNLVPKNYLKKKKKTYYYITEKIDNSYQQKHSKTIIRKP